MCTHSSLTQPIERKLINLFKNMHIYRDVLKKQSSQGYGYGYGLIKNVLKFSNGNIFLHKFIEALKNHKWIWKVTCMIKIARVISWH